MKTPLSYHGGKARMVNDLMKMVPRHTVYCEPFCGGASLFWAKPLAKVSVLNDASPLVVNFYRCLRDDPDRLVSLIEQVRFCREDYERARKIISLPPRHIRAAQLRAPYRLAQAFWACCSMGFGKQPLGGFGDDNDGRTERAFYAKQARLREQMGEYESQLKTTHIHHGSYITPMLHYDSPDTFHYLDPPYVGTKGYENVWDEGDLRLILFWLPKLKGKFMLSHFPNVLIQAAADEHGWYRKDFTKRTTLNKPNSTLKTECVWINSPLPNELF